MCTRRTTPVRRRRRIHDIPGPDSALWLLGKPRQDAAIGVEMEVLPYKDRWEWRVRLTFNGFPSLSDYLFGSWHHPTPHEVRGRCHNQGVAWQRARVTVDDARARIAASQMVRMQRRKERVAL